MNKAVSFEYEWMMDGTLRLRFLARTNDIVGQTIIDQKSLVRLQTLISFAVVKTTKMSAFELLSMCKHIGMEVSLSDMEAMLDAVRVRVDMVSDGGTSMTVVE